MLCDLNYARHGIIHPKVSGSALKLKLQPPLVFGNHLQVVMLLLLDAEGVLFDVPDGYHIEVFHLFLYGGEILGAWSPLEAFGNVGQVK